MSYLAALSLAVRARALSDSGPGGLFGSPSLIQGIWDTEAPAASAVSFDFPFVVYDIAALAQEDAFRLAADLVEVRFHVYVDKRMTIDSPLTASTKIMARIMGDWTSQPYGTPPTYGYDRWAPGALSTALPGAWVADIMERTSPIADHVDGVYHFIQPFRLYVSRAGA